MNRRIGALILSISVPSVALAQNGVDRHAVEKAAWVERSLASFSLEEKVGQLIFGGVPTTFTNITEADFDRVRKELEKYHLGGYHAFSGSVLGVAHLTRRMQQLSSFPLLITADLEGGAGYIFDGGTRFPRGMALGATGDADLVRRVGEATAREARQLGIHVNFYPVVDVNNNPENPIINIRSFGEDPQSVALLADAYIEGFQSGGLLATAKHFPGHGDTDVDSHIGLPVIEASLDRLRQVELVPFRAAVDHGVGAVMTAHLAVPALDPDPTLPATLSKKIVGGVLRQDMGFEGLVVTDAMDMDGVARGRGAGEAAVQALEAGADVILLPNLEESYRSILEAVRSGRISQRRLDASVRRILAAKAHVGLNVPDRDAALDRVDIVVGSKENEEVAQAAMDAAVTLLRDDKNALPLHLADSKTVLILSMMEERRQNEFRGPGFVREFRRRHSRVLHFTIDPEATSNEVALTNALAGRVDAVVVAAYVRVAARKGNLALSEQQLRLIEWLSSKKNFVFVLFGSPYYAASLPELPSLMVTYEDYPGAERAAVKTILGEVPFRGTLPVTLPDLFPRGHGILK